MVAIGTQSVLRYRKQCRRLWFCKSPRLAQKVEFAWHGIYCHYWELCSRLLLPKFVEGLFLSAFITRQFVYSCLKFKFTQNINRKCLKKKQCTGIAKWKVGSCSVVGNASSVYELNQEFLASWIPKPCLCSFDDRNSWHAPVQARLPTCWKT
jgi:hypothetical protein